MKMMFLRQGTHSIEDYVVDFLELAHLTHSDEICLMIFFQGGLSEPLSSIMPLHDPNWTLEKYIDIALQLSGSPFTVGATEEERDAALTQERTPAPEHAHKMAATMESGRKMVVTTTPRHVIATSHESSQVTADSHGSSQVTAALPEPHKMPVAFLPLLQSRVFMVYVLLC